MRLTMEAKRAMPGARTWLRENAPYNADLVEWLNCQEVIGDIEQYYPGGWLAFSVRTWEQ